MRVHFICLIWAFQLSILSYCQPKPLSIGDTLPAQLITSLTGNLQPVTGNPQLVTANQKPATGNRLIILDFFATWCTSCYKKFPHLDSLQQQFTGSLAIILVNTVSAREDSATIAAFFAKRKNLNGALYQFPYILGDSVFNKLFPHILLPHYIWIYNNRFIATTNSEWVTASNIRAVLSGIPVHWEIKTDSLQFEKRKRLINK